MLDYAITIRQQFIASQAPVKLRPDPAASEIHSLPNRRHAAIQYLRRRGKLIIDAGNTFRPNWGEPDPRFASYAEGV